jgi:hypothetical protein
MAGEIRCRRVEACGLKICSVLEVETARLGYVAVIGAIEPSNRWRDETDHFTPRATSGARI